MSNKKVYLAKNVLASGFDVEYVKSHLLRIPGIVIIESGMSVDPSECAAFIIVPDAGFKDNPSGQMPMSKNVAQALEEFVMNYDGDNCVEESIYIFSRPKTSDEPGDCEISYPMAFYVSDEFEIDILDKDNYDAFASLELVEGDDMELLHALDEILDVGRSWVKVPRHFSPPPVFAVPAVPSLEERKLKQYPSSVANSSVFDTGALQSQIHVNRRRLLLLRRK
jgi:hypothetical protein